MAVDMPTTDANDWVSGVPASATYGDEAVSVPDTDATDATERE